MAWEQTHGESIAGYSEGTVYGPQIRPGRHEYFGVSADDYVSMLSKTFPENTNIADAHELVLQDFPADATITITDTDDPICEIVLIRSPTLEAARCSAALAAFFSPSDEDQLDRAPGSEQRRRRRRDGVVR